MLKRLASVIEKKGEPQQTFQNAGIYRANGVEGPGGQAEGEAEPSCWVICTHTFTELISMQVPNLSFL